MIERTSKDFIDDMLANGRNWIAILAVSRAIRSGKWYDECRSQLQERGLMPMDDATVLKERIADTSKPPVLEKPKFFTGKKKNF